jgi:hypothetical protein
MNHHSLFMNLRRLIIPSIVVSLLWLNVQPSYSQGISELHSFRAISLESPIDDLAIVSGGELVDCMIPSHRRSQTFALAAGEQTLRFVKRGSVIPPEGVQLLPVLLEVPVATGYKNPLYIFYPNPDSSDAPYVVFPIEDSPARFEGGMGIFVNLSSYPMVLLFGENGSERIQLASQKTYLHAFKGDSVNVRVRIATYAEDAVQKGMDTRVFPAVTHRDIYFIYPVRGQGTGMVRMRLLREHTNAAKRAYSGSPRKNRVE